MGIYPHYFLFSWDELGPHGVKQDKADRAEGLYNLDRSAPFKRAERNPVVASVLEKFTEEERHEMLHVNYVKE